MASHGPVSVADLRTSLSDTLNRAAYGHERVAITRRGKVTAVLVSVEDWQRLEALEDEADRRAYLEAKTADDGGRVGLDELLADEGA